MSWLAVRRLMIVVGFGLLGSDGVDPAEAQTETPGPESTYVKLLKKAPEARLGAIIDVVGKRGDASDLAYLLDRATTTDPTAFAAGPRALALTALVEAASTRNLRPSTDLDRLNRLIATGPEPDPATRSAAIRLVGIWKLDSAIPGLVAVAGATTGIEAATRSAAIAALAAIGSPPAEAAIERLAGPGSPREVQNSAIAALARLDIAAAADRAAGVIATATPDQDLAPLVAAFLDRQTGSEALLKAIQRHPPTADGARLTLRAISALGRADETLVAALSKVAGIEADPPPPTPVEMAALVTDVTTLGNAERGERIFRRGEINCTRCHAISGAGGGVGPDLSAVGLSSPVDYVINSILIPDQAVKEEYQTRVILTEDGQILQGIVVEEDDRRVVLKDAVGERRVVATSAIEASKRGGSLMPKGLVATLTRAEFLDLVRFVSELGRPGHYAIRATPTIQRWRALHPVPRSIADSTAISPETLQSDVLAAPTSAWVPTYSWTAGELPIAEIVTACESRIGIIQGEITVSAAGPVQFRFEGVPRPDLLAWVDDLPIKIDPDGSVTVPLNVGPRRLTVRVDANQDHGPPAPIRVEVARVAGSPAEFSVVGGR